MSARDDFEREFPNEPMAPGAMGRASVRFTGGYVAPGNPFAPIPVGEPGIRFSQSAAEAREGLPEVGSGYVFVRGVGFVEVGRGAPLVVPPPPTDWSKVSVAAAEEPIVYADLPFIDPEFKPKATEFESAPRDSVEKEPVSFWSDVGSIFTTSAPVLASNWFETGNVWGRQAPVQIPQRPMVPLPQGINLMGTPARAAPAQSIARPAMQDQSLCAPTVTNPKFLRYNCQTGEFSKVPRRRRRRLLTGSDLKDLAALKTIVGGGQGMNGAVVQAIRR